VKNQVLPIPVLALGAVLLTPCWCRPADVSQHQAGSAPQLAPDFSLTDLAGKKLALSAYRGTVVLLNFWATWCGPCREEIPSLVSLQEKYRNKGLQIIGISLDDDAAPIPAFYRQYKMNYPVAIGDAALAERYGGILGLPVSLLVGCDGRIYSRHDGIGDISLIEQEVTLRLQGKECRQTKARK